MSNVRGEIPNPYVGNDRYHCFGCDPHNDAGLRLSFYRDGEVVTSSWEPREEFEGYPGVVHGGIQATLADEIGGWYIHSVLGTAGMTRELHVTYLVPAETKDGPFRLEARLHESEGRNATVAVHLFGAGGTLYTTARCTYAVFSEAVARRKLHFPGREAFQPGPE